MLDEILELFERRKGHKKSSGGLRGRIGRAIAGGDHQRDRHDDGDSGYERGVRRYDRDDDDNEEHRDRRDSKRSRFGDAFDFD